MQETGQPSRILDNLFEVMADPAGETHEEIVDALEGEGIQINRLKQRLETFFKEEENKGVVRKWKSTKHH